MSRRRFKIIDDANYYSIRPGDIDLSKNLRGTFGKHEVEVAAANLVRFFQKRGVWAPFTIEELLNFSKSVKFNPDRIFFGLLGPWEDDTPVTGGIRDARPYLVIGADGQYRVTDIFVKKCLKKNSK